MSRHKLGWQTSDQQDKAVSCEVGVLLVSASVRQAAWGQGRGLCSARACCQGPAPGTCTSPEPGP